MGASHRLPVREIEEAFMRRFTFAAVVLVALVATSYAVAHGIEGAKTSRALAGGFDAASANVSSRTCTTSDNKTIVITDGKYTGAATGDADLTGNITVHARSVVNTTDKIGTVEGAFRIDVANGKDTQAAFSAVYDNGNIAGLAAGKAHAPNARLIANLSSLFDPAKGFTGAKLGGGTGGGSAVEVSAGPCKPQAKPTKEHSSAKGTITQLTGSTITVAALTCTIPPDKSAEVNARFKQNDVVEIQCTLVSGTNTLTHIEKHH
jgi:hypothetical protein